MPKTPISKFSYALRNLRHLYEQMLVPGGVTKTKEAAQGLLGPAIAALEEEQRRLEAIEAWYRANDEDGSPFT